jgi:hypothetical protein
MLKTRFLCTKVPNSEFELSSILPIIGCEAGLAANKVYWIVPQFGLLADASVNAKLKLVKIVVCKGIV